jgi:DNA polymerase III subunit delta'
LTLNGIKGQERVVSTLKRAISSSRLAHCYLFEGPSGTGRRTTALALIQSVFCANSADGSGCGNCATCRKLETGNHPDLHILQPLPDKRDISIEQIRELQQVLSLRPYEAPRKACLIEPAERLSIGASNAMLKTLEEPPGNALMILIASQADQLLSTIRSRCQQLRFAKLSEDEIKLLLINQGMDAAQAATVAPLAEGSMEKALQISVEPDIERKLELIELLSRASTKQIATIFDPAEQLAGPRDETVETLSMFVSLLRDLVFIKSNSHDSVVNRPIMGQLEELSSSLSIDGAMEAVELALEAVQSVRRNVNAKLAIEHFMLGFAGLKCLSGNIRSI